MSVPDIWTSNKGRFHVSYFLTQLLEHYQSQLFLSIEEDRKNDNDNSHWWYEKHQFIIGEIHEMLKMVDRVVEP